MDNACIEARDYLSGRWDEVKALHPEYYDVGTLAYMLPNRICFSIKLVNGRRKSVQYARILLELKLGRVLGLNETVDHEDFDVSNNSIENLQLLSRSDNSSKGASDETKSRISALNSSRMAGNSLGLGQKNGMAKLTNLQVLEIKKFQERHFSGQDSVLARQFNVSRELISQIRRGKVRV